MYFKVTPDSATYAALLNLQARIKECNAAARQLTEQHGAYAYAGGSELGGGVRAFCFREKPEGWKLVQSPNYYMPKVAKVNDALFVALAALPVVKNKELNDLLGWTGGLIVDGDSFRISSRPGVSWGDDFIVIDASRQMPTNPDLTEILESEYRTLTAKREPAEA